MPVLSILLLVSSSAWWAYAQIEIMKVEEENVTLPCHHELGRLGLKSLDIEWWFEQKPESAPNMVIGYSDESVYNYPSMNQRGRVSFASNFRAGDASLYIRSLEPGDAGMYSCKVKNGWNYKLERVILKVLVKPSEPKCWMEGELSEGGNITLECKSAAGTEPIQYKWATVSGKEQILGVLPATSSVGIFNPARVRLWNLSTAHSGLYRCTATNEAGHKTCDVQVIVHRKADTLSIGIIIGAVCGVIVGILLIILSVCLLVRMRKRRKLEEEETPNEIREDAEAPKARLVKPDSSSSGSRSSHSGSSSTKSTTNSACRSQQTPSTQMTLPQYRRAEMERRENEPSKCSHSSSRRIDSSSVTNPGQSGAFQTV
ncbi:CXADR-like membrane protein [Microcaecilia unicolor]|uniref:CXADR-like membrane protein n=1 Tax=Microcaecilia unicolor TaxID=1415580 RepID=A0A6P7WU13_9AMPH|nr:CXADR-like membrane protein [Microcaecilia unicolor]